MSSPTPLPSSPGNPPPTDAKRGRAATRTSQAGLGLRLKLVWDYGMFPVRSFEPIDHGFHSLPLPISADLRVQLQDWSDQWTEVMLAALTAPGTSEGIQPPDDVVEAWEARARVLLARLRAELGLAFLVEYRTWANRTTDEWEWPGSA